MPLKPAIFDILLSLADGERHGWAMTQEIEARTGAGPDPGNLYRSLRTMLDAGLIEECARRPAADLDDERRRYYRITGEGKRAAREEIARLEGVLRTAKSKRWTKTRA
jgi:DNA-binding PadR family transcriptional regulator